MEDSLFDLSDLSLPKPRPVQVHDWLCGSCLRVSITKKSCAVCNCREFIPYLDRRPLLLNKEVKNGIVDLINQAADRVPQADIDEQLYFTGDYMPFLSKLLDAAQVAEDRKASNDSGYRETNLSTSELLLLFKEMKLPPSI
jgi:hypothetical protein